MAGAHRDQSAWLGPFFTVNAAFFMGLFFLIAGYFSAAAYARRGPWRFLAARALRLGTPAITTRGFGVEETRQLTGWIADILDDLENEETIERVRSQVLELCARFPVYA